MKIKELVEYFKKQDQENLVWIESQDGTEILEICEIIESKEIGTGTTSTIIVTEQSVGNGDYLEPLK